MPKARDNLNFYGAIQPRQFGRLGQAIIDNGEMVIDQRKLFSYEVINANLKLANPVDRVVSHPQRRMNLGFAFAEAMSEFVGEDSLRPMKAFIATYDKYSSNGVTIDGSYAARIYQTSGDSDQLQAVYRMLKKEKSSRRAVVSLYVGQDDLFGAGGKNTPCTLSLQFLIRKGFLHAITTMRSNDYWLGLTYDVFNFSFIQEWLARRLRVELGYYYHNVGSLHVYSANTSNVCSLDVNPSPWTTMMQPMSFAAADYMLDCAYSYMAMADDASRGILSDHAHIYTDGVKTDYCRNIIYVGYAYLAKKVSIQHAVNVAQKITDPTLRYVTMNWLED